MQNTNIKKVIIAVIGVYIFCAILLVFFMNQPRLYANPRINDTDTVHAVTSQTPKSATNPIPTESTYRAGMTYHEFLEYEGKAYFVGEIIYIDNNSMTAMVTDSGTSNIPIHREVQVSRKMRTDNVENFNPGDVVDVAFEPSSNAYSLKINNVYAVYKVED